MRYFCDRYKVASKIPEHVSATCMVIRAVDTGFAGDGREDDVVIKLMRHEDQFNREISARQRSALGKGLDPDLVVPVLATSADADLKEGWIQEVYSKLSPGRDFNFGLIMPAAHRNLMVVLLQERVDLDEIKHIVRHLSRCLQHLHENGVIHGDFKPLNAVRMPGGVQWSLIDLDAAVRIGCPVAVKCSTAFCPPELTATVGGSGPSKTTRANMNRSSFNNNKSKSGSSKKFLTGSSKLSAKLLNGSGKFSEQFSSRRNSIDMTGLSHGERIVFRLPVVNHHSTNDAELRPPEDGGYDLLEAAPSYDIWSMGVVYYRILTRRNLFETNDQDNLSREQDKQALHDWNHEALNEVIVYTNSIMRSNGAVSTMNRLLACDLLAWLLQRNPNARPESFREVLSHPFLALGESMSEDDVDHQAWRIPQLHVLAALNKTREALPLLEACAKEEGSINTGDTLLGRTALHIAASEGNLDFVKLLLKQPHINADARDGSGNTVLLTCLSLMDSSNDWMDAEQEKRMLAVIEVICSVADLSLRDSVS